MDGWIDWTGFGSDWSHAHENQVVLVMSSFGTSHYDITSDRTNVELIPYVRALISIDFEHSVIIWGWFPNENHAPCLPRILVIRYQAQIRHGLQRVHYRPSEENRLVFLKTICMGTWFKACFICSNIELRDEKMKIKFTVKLKEMAQRCFFFF